MKWYLTTKAPFKFISLYIPMHVYVLLQIEICDWLSQAEVIQSGMDTNDSTCADLSYAFTICKLHGKGMSLAFVMNAPKSVGKIFFISYSPVNIFLVKLFVFSSFNYSCIAFKGLRNLQ